MTEFKSVDFKADDNGTITGYFSTWTREPDSYGDVVAKGAFAESFAKIAETGGTVPLLWNHDASDVDNFIGVAGDLEEDEHGAKFVGRFDSTETAQRARQLVKDGRIGKLSFAYDTLDAADVELEDGRRARELRKLNLHEVSLVMYPANRDTSITDVKSGRRNSAKDEKELKAVASMLRDAAKRLDQLIEATVDEGETEGADEAETGKSAPDASAKFAELIARIDTL